MMADDGARSLQESAMNSLEVDNFMKKSALSRDTTVSVYSSVLRVLLCLSYSSTERSDSLRVQICVAAEAHHSLQYSR